MSRVGIPRESTNQWRWMVTSASRMKTTPCPSRAGDWDINDPDCCMVSTFLFNSGANCLAQFGGCYVLLLEEWVARADGSTNNTEPCMWVCSSCSCRAGPWPWPQWSCMALVSMTHSWFLATASPLGTSCSCIPGGIGGIPHSLGY